MMEPLTKGQAGKTNPSWKALRKELYRKYAQYSLKEISSTVDYIFEQKT